MYSTSENLKRIHLKSTYWENFFKWYFVPPKEQILKYPYKHIHTPWKNWVIKVISQCLCYAHSEKAYKSYIEAPYLAPVFTSKPIITAYSALRLTLVISFCSLLFLFSCFSQKSHLSKNIGTLKCLRLIPDNLVERANLYHVIGE